MESSIKIVFPSNKDIFELNKDHFRLYQKLSSYELFTNEHLNRYLIQTNLVSENILDEIKNIEAHPHVRYRKLKPFNSIDMETKFLENKIIEIILGYRTIEGDYNKEDYMENLPEDDQYLQLSKLKQPYSNLSIEYLLDENRKTLLAYYCCLNGKTGERLFSSKEDFLDQKISDSAKFLIRETSSFLNGLQQTIIRKIARHSAWRTRWISATKTGAVLFDGNVSDWDINKLLLCYWSNFYDNIYSGGERPEQFIIDDDEMLDNWLEGKARGTSDSISAGNDPDKDTLRGTFRTRINPIKKKN